MENLIPLTINNNCHEKNKYQCENATKSSFEIIRSDDRHPQDDIHPTRPRLQCQLSPPTNDSIESDLLSARQRANIKKYHPSVRSWTTAPKSCQRPIISRTQFKFFSGLKFAVLINNVCRDEGRGEEGVGNSDLSTVEHYYYERC